MDCWLDRGGNLKTSDSSITTIIISCSSYSPDTARALDAAGHDGFDERPDVLVLDCSFPLCETTAVCTKLHGLILVGQQVECQTHIKTVF